MVVVHCYDSLLMIESCVWVERQLFKGVGVLIYHIHMHTSTGRLHEEQYYD